MSRRRFAAPGLLVLPILLGDVQEERFLQLLENRGVLVVGVPDADDRRLGLQRRHVKPSHGAAIGMRADEVLWLLMWEATSVSPRSKRDEEHSATGQLCMHAPLVHAGCGRRAGLRWLS